MSVTISNKTLTMTIILLALLLWLMTRQPEPPRRREMARKRPPYLTPDELAAYKWREGKIS